MGRVSNVIDQTLTGEWSQNIEIPPGATEIQFVFDRTRFELPSPEDIPEGELFRCELNFGDGWFGGGSDDARIEGKRTPRPGQRMLWTFFRWPLPKGITSLPVRVRPVRPFNCLMHVDFFPQDIELINRQIEAVENL